jgi:hypothetical protein
VDPHPSAPSQELASELRVLHKALMRAGQAAYEAAHGPLTGTSQLLRLLVEDPAFAWLRPLSELMADLDALLELGERLTDEEARAVRAEVEHLLSPAGSAIWPALTAHLQAHPDVATAYARVRQRLLALPTPVQTDAAEALHAQHRWAELRRHRHDP